MFITKIDSYKLSSDVSLRKVARSLRQNATLAEQKLWQYLRNKQINGIKFRRQHSLHGYIVDFYCYTHRLVIEVDEPVHQDHIVHDKSRDQHLQNRGYKILRFSNVQVIHHITEVLDTIRNCSLPPE